MRFRGYIKNPYRYNAERVDYVPGIADFQYLRARYYRPDLARFISQDIVWGTITTPLSQNLFIYVQNNPVNMTDPSGLYPKEAEEYYKNKISEAVKNYTALEGYQEKVFSQMDKMYMQSQMRMYEKQIASYEQTLSKMTGNPVSDSIGLAKKIAVRESCEDDIRYKNLIERVENVNLEQFKKDFVQQAFLLILVDEKNTGVPAEITFGQICAESEYGSKTLVDIYTGVNANNYFGIKGSGPAGSVFVNTHEYINGKKVLIIDEFKAYTGIEESIEDHSNLLNKRYKQFVTTGTPEDWAAALEKGGYATAPNYGDSILDVAEYWRVY